MKETTTITIISEYTFVKGIIFVHKIMDKINKGQNNEIMDKMLIKTIKLSLDF